MIHQYQKSLTTMGRMGVLPVIVILADVPALAGTEIDLRTDQTTLAVEDRVELKPGTGVDRHVFDVGFALDRSGGGES
jgi:hypothetical protein